MMHFFSIGMWWIWINLYFIQFEKTQTSRDPSKIGSGPIHGSWPTLRDTLVYIRTIAIRIWKHATQFYYYWYNIFVLQLHSYSGGIVCPSYCYYHYYYYPCMCLDDTSTVSINHDRGTSRTHQINPTSSEVHLHIITVTL